MAHCVIVRRAPPDDCRVRVHIDYLRAPDFARPESVHRVLLPSGGAFAGPAAPGPHSHSIVAGGFEEMS